MDKAEEYAALTMGRLIHDNEPIKAEMWETELACAWRAGHAQGVADATKKEVVNGSA